MYVAIVILILVQFCTNNKALDCDIIPDEIIKPKNHNDLDRYIIYIQGNPKSYTPYQKYNVSLKVNPGKNPQKPFRQFFLTLESVDSENSGKAYHPTGHFEFEYLSHIMTKFSEKCPNTVVENSKMPKWDIQVYWIAPPEGSGCVAIKATVVESRENWFSEDGQLTKILCEDSDTNENVKPPLVDKCCACSEAKYEVSFEGRWTRNTHPRNYPSDIWSTKFSDIIGASHSKYHSFWNEQDYASDALKELAENGKTQKLESDIKAMGKNIRTIIKARGLQHPNITESTYAVFRVDNNNHLVSLVSKITPSPDWFVGVSNFELCQSDCTWVESYTYNLYPVDAGTDDGIGYLSSEPLTFSRKVITPITPNNPNNPKSPFYDEDGNPMNPVAKLHFTRQRLYDSPCESNEDEDSRDENDCATTAWGDWTPCSVACGIGKKTRIRQYVQPKRAQDCFVRLVEQQICKGSAKYCKAIHKFYSEESEDTSATEKPENNKKTIEKSEEKGSEENDSEKKDSEENDTEEKDTEEKATEEKVSVDDESGSQKTSKRKKPTKMHKKTTKHKKVVKKTSEQESEDKQSEEEDSKQPVSKGKKINKQPKKSVKINESRTHSKNHQSSKKGSDEGNSKGQETDPDQSGEKKSDEKKSTKKASKVQDSEEKSTEEETEGSEEKKSNEDASEEEKTDEENSQKKKSDEEATEEKKSEEAKPNKKPSGKKIRKKGSKQESDEKKSKQEKSEEQKSQKTKSEEEKSEENQSYGQESEDASDINKSKEEKSEEKDSEEKQSDQEGKNSDEELEEEVSEEKRSDEKNSDETKSDENKSGEKKTDENQSDEKESNEKNSKVNKSEQNSEENSKGRISGEEISEEIKLDENNSEENKSEKKKSEDGNSDENNSNEKSAEEKSKEQKTEEESNQKQPEKISEEQKSEEDKSEEKNLKQGESDEQKSEEKNSEEGSSISSPKSKNLTKKNKKINESKSSKKISEEASRGNEEESEENNSKGNGSKGDESDENNSEEKESEEEEPKSKKKLTPVKKNKVIKKIESKNNSEKKSHTQQESDEKDFKSSLGNNSKQSDSEDEEQNSNKASEEKDSADDSSSKASDEEESKKSEEEKCSVEEWSEWSSCSAKCGRGTKTRDRKLLFPENEEECEEVLLQENAVCRGPQKICRNEANTKCSNQNWGLWSSCSVSCGQGIKRRLRLPSPKRPKSRKHKKDDEDEEENCTNQEIVKCHVDCNIGQKLGESLIIEQAPDGRVVHCKVSDWSIWTKCDLHEATCGNGIRKRSRQILRHPENGGRACPKKLMQQQTCNVPCSNLTEESQVDNRPKCIMSDWTDFTPCSSICGNSAMQMKTRKILYRPPGVVCPSRVMHRPCNLPLACTSEGRPIYL